MKLFLRYSIISIALLLLGCKKGDVCQDLDIIETTATLMWTGDYAHDGCGFRIKIGEQTYKPENEKDIDTSFKEQNYYFDETTHTVKLRYIPRGNRLDVPCGFSKVTKPIDYIYVISVERL